MLLTMLVGLWATLLAAPGTPIGRGLARWLVVKPAAVLSGIRRGAVLAVLALVVVGLSCWFVMGHEGVLVYGMALPELTAAMAMMDLGVMLDVAVVMVATISTGSWRALRMILPRYRARTPRARRSRAARKPASNDDGEGPAAAWALAA